MRPRKTRVISTGVVLALTVVAPLNAQWQPEPTFPISHSAALLVEPPLRRAEAQRSKQADDFALSLAGLAGAAVGSLGGAYLGYHLDREVFHWDGGDDPGIWGSVGGWFIGSALTTPVSVHLANRGRGSLSSAYLSSALIAGVGMAGLLMVGSPQGAFFLWGAPLAQAVSAVLIERDAAR